MLPSPTKLSVSHMIEQYRKSTEIRFQLSRQRFILQTHQFVCYYMLLYVNQHRSECKLEIHIFFFVLQMSCFTVFLGTCCVLAPSYQPAFLLTLWAETIVTTPLLNNFPSFKAFLSFIFYFFAIIIRGGNGGSHCVMNSLPNYALSTDLIDWSTCFSNTDYY